jgi:hypothetical protein
MQNRGTGLTKGTAVQAIKEAERLGILRHRRNTSATRGYGASSYSISWKRVMELAQEARSKPGRTDHWQIRPSCDVTAAIRKRSELAGRPCTSIEQEYGQISDNPLFKI